MHGPCSSGASRVRERRVHPDRPRVPPTRLAPLLHGWRKPDLPPACTADAACTAPVAAAQAASGNAAFTLTDRVYRRRGMHGPCSSGASRVRERRVHPDPPRTPPTRLAPLLHGWRKPDLPPACTADAACTTPVAAAQAASRQHHRAQSGALRYRSTNRFIEPSRCRVCTASRRLRTICGEQLFEQARYKSVVINAGLISNGRSDT